MILHNIHFPPSLKIFIFIFQQKNMLTTRNDTISLPTSSVKLYNFEFNPFVFFLNCSIFKMKIQKSIYIDITMYSTVQ